MRAPYSITAAVALILASGLAYSQERAEERRQGRPELAGEMSIGSKAESSSYPTTSLGRLWRQKTYSGWAFNKEFNDLNTDTEAGAPAVSVLSVAYANGTRKDVVGNMGIAIANSNNSSLFGFNFIAASTGHKSAVFRGGEIDVEPAKTDTPLPGSAGLYFNAYSKLIPGAVIQSNGLDGGAFTNGFSCGGVVGTCLFASPGATPQSLVNASLGSYSSSAFVTGTGISQGFAWGNRGRGVSPYTYGDEANNFVVRLGRAGSFRVEGSAGNSSLLEVKQSGVVSLRAALQLPKTSVASLPVCDRSNEGELAAVTDARSAAFNAPALGGGSNHMMVYCNGSGWTVH